METGTPASDRPRAFARMIAAIGAGAESASSLLERQLHTIADINPRLNAFVHVCTDEARRDARASDERRRNTGPISALDGVTVAVKDNIDLRGCATTAGMIQHRGRIAAEDSASVAKLRAAGAIVLGKTNLPEGGLGPTTNNPLFGSTDNPHLSGKTAGGSSGGSAAAVAAGLCTAALGTDTLGSVRIPASYCGVVGFKPSFGRVSLRGVIPLAWSFDTLGILATATADAAAIFDAIAGYDPACPYSVEGSFAPVPDSRRPLRLCVPKEIDSVGCQPPVIAAFESAMKCAETLGCEVVIESLGFEIAAVRRAGFLYSEAQAAVVHEGFDRQLLSPGVAALLDFGSKASARDLAKADLLLRHAAAKLRNLLAEADFLAMPTTPQTAFDQGQPPPSNVGDLTALASIAHLPALSLPCGRDGDGLPIGLHLIGRSWGDAAVLRLAEDFEGVIDAAAVFDRHRNENLGARFSRSAAMPSR